MLQRFLTLRQVDEELDTKDSTLSGLIRLGKMPIFQVGGRGQWCIERTKLENYIAAAAYARACLGMTQIHSLQAEEGSADDT